MLAFNEFSPVGRVPGGHRRRPRPPRPPARPADEGGDARLDHRGASRAGHRSTPGTTPTNHHMIAINERLGVHGRGHPPGVPRGPARGPRASAARRYHRCTAPHPIVRSSSVLRTACIAVLLLALSGCTQGRADGGGGKADTAAPELGACRSLVPDDIAQASNATAPVGCTAKHTAETFSVGTFPADLARDDPDDRALGRLRLRPLPEQVPAVPRRRREPGAALHDDLGVVPAHQGRLGRRARTGSAATWSAAASSPSPSSPCPKTAKGLLLGKPDDRWLVCVDGPSVSGSVKIPCSSRRTPGARSPRSAWARTPTPTPATGSSRSAPGTSAPVGGRLAELPDRLRLRLHVVPRGRVEGRQPPLDLLGQDRPVTAVARCLARPGDGPAAGRVHRRARVRRPGSSRQHARYVVRRALRPRRPRRPRPSYRRRRGSPPATGSSTAPAHPAHQRLDPGALHGAGTPPRRSTSAGSTRSSTGTRSRSTRPPCSGSCPRRAPASSRRTSEGRPPRAT